MPTGYTPPTAALTGPFAKMDSAEIAPAAASRPARVFQLFQQDPLLALGTLGLSLAVLLPLTQTPILPLNDLPNHIAMSALLRHILAGDAVAAQHFMLQPHPAPYWLMYLLILGASYVLPTLVAAKAVVAITILSIPFGMMRLLSALGRSPRMGLWAFALCWEFSVSMGFIAYTLTFGLALFFLARCVEALRPEGASVRSLAVTVLLGLVLAQSHAHVAGAASVLVCALALSELPHFRRAVRIALLSLGPTLGLLPWILLGSQAEGRPRPERIGHWPDAGERISRMFHYTLDLVNGAELRNLLGLSFITLLLVPLLLGARGGGGEPSDKRARVLYFTSWVLYLVMPASIEWPFYQLLIHERHATQVLLFGLLLPAGTFTGHAAWRLLPGVVVALAVAAAVTVQCARFSREVEPFLAVIDAVKPGSRVAWVLWQQRTPESVRDTLPQVPAYLLAEKGGYSPYLFQTPNLPLRYRDGSHLPHTHWHHPGAFSMSEHGVHYDYVLVQGKQSDRFQEGLIQVAAGTFRARVALEAGIWRLYSVAREP